MLPGRQLAWHHYKRLLPPQLPQLPPDGWHSDIMRFHAAPPRPAISAAHFTLSITAASRVATLFQITSPHLGVGELGGLQRGHVAPQPELLHLQPLQVLLPLADLALHRRVNKSGHILTFLLLKIFWISRQRLYQ